MKSSLHNLPCLQDLNKTLILLSFWTIFSTFTLKFILLLVPMTTFSFLLSIVELDSVKMLTNLTPGPDWLERSQAPCNIGIYGTFSLSSPISNNNNRTQGSDPLGTYLIQFPWNVLQKGIDVCSRLGAHIGQLVYWGVWK